MTEAVTVIELVHPSGHWLELQPGWPRFPQVLAAIGSMLFGLAPDWFEVINWCKVGDPPVEA
jgi:hypothetical protein